MAAPPFQSNVIYRDYRAPKAAVIQAAREGISSLGYRIQRETSDGRLHFSARAFWKSWNGQEMSATVTAIEDSSRLELVGNLSPGFPQIYDWGEAETIARRVLQAMQIGSPMPILNERLHAPGRRGKNVAAAFVILSPAVFLAIFLTILALT